MVPVAQRVAPSLPPQLVKGFPDKCFFLSAENTNILKLISVENIEMLNGNVPVLTPFLPACPASCLLSSLLATLASAGLLSCKVLGKAPFGFKTLESATARVVCFCQSK